MLRDEEQVRKHLTYFCKKGPPSLIGVRVGQLLEEWDGLHHFEDDLMRKMEWSHPLFIKMNFRGSLSSFDFDGLTRLLFLAHDHCIRVEVRPCNPQLMTVLFHPRLREGAMPLRHPTLEQAVEAWRSNHLIPAEACT